MGDFNKIIKRDKPVLVDFYAAWCGPCKMMPPILDDLKNRMGDKATIIKIDVDKNQHLARKLSIRGVPTLVLYKKGKIVWRESGVRQAGELEKIISNHL
ncbi:MAG: thioredoxin [Bacteroidota bacterium]